MLVKLLPEQVMNYWDLIKEGIEACESSVNSYEPMDMESVQAHLLGGVIHCWVSVNKKPKVVAFVITKIVHSDFTNNASLLILAIYAFEKTTGSDWVEGFETLKKFALSRGCKKIIGYTINDKVLKIVDKFGGDTNCRFISIPIQTMLNF